MQSHPSAELNILLVDDERQTLKYFERAFAKDFNVLTAASADEAEQIVDANVGKIGVVISDQRMPGRNGVSLLSAVRRKQPAIVRMLTTAYSELDDAIEAVNRGEIFRYIVKPWDFDLLRQEINTGLLVYRLQAERELLIGEKLHVRQRMLAVDRARDLAVIVAGLPKLRHAKLAANDYVRDCATYPTGTPAQKEDGNAPDLWSAPQAEARHMGAVASEVARIADIMTAGGKSGSLDAAARSAVAETAAQATAGKVTVASASGTAPAINVPDGVVNDVVASALAVVIASTAEGGKVQVTIGSGTVNGVAGAVLSIATQQAVGAAYTLLYGTTPRGGRVESGRLFAAYIAAREYGGTIKLDHKGEALSIEIALPGEGQAGQVPDARPDWLDRLFQNFEAWPG